MLVSSVIGKAVCSIEEIEERVDEVEIMLFDIMIRMVLLLVKV